MNKTNNILQYEGFLNTVNLFSSSNNPFKQSLFEVSTSKDTPNNIELKENLMLGKRVEEFFKLQVKLSKNHIILYENIQVQKERRTIGELDIILQDLKTKILKHIEISYKFYLYDPKSEGKDLDKWIGPNRNDNLKRKINKLSTRQFPLLHKPETKEKLDIDTDSVEQELFFKAQLFIPFNYKKQTYNTINSDAICGYYISFEAFQQNIFFKSSFYVPNKQDWLINPIKNTTWHTYDQVYTSVKKLIDINKSPLIWRKDNENKITKFFIIWW